MPVSSQQERTTSTTHATTPEQSTPLLPSQQEFHQYLRLLTQSAVRTVIEAVMHEELDALIGAAWGCSRPSRRRSARQVPLASPPPRLREWPVGQLAQMLMECLLIRQCWSGLLLC